MPGSFIDTNVLVYLASNDTAKADRAEELLREGGTINVQVLNELTNVARRKMGMTWDETRGFLSLLRELLAVQPVTVEVHDLGIMLAARHGFSVFDAMIVASAQLAGCSRLWSEDMQHGMKVDGTLTIANPFR